MKIKIRYIDGERLKRSILASAARIAEMQEKLNSINVFPVADADTGTNMVLTMQGIVQSTQNCPFSSFDKVCACIAEGALSGARGNSGAILAQFFYGLAEGTDGKERLSSHEFAQAVSHAVHRAREALADPKEGTILTVMQDWADHLKHHAIGEKDFAQLFRDALKRARQSLADTPKKLQLLRKAGVVDAGAQGFVHLLEGLTDFIDTGKIAAFRATTHAVEKIRSFHKKFDDVRFRFCTECLIHGSNLQRLVIQQRLSPFGDSLIVVGGRQKIRVHIHTNDPEQVFAAAADFGSISQKKTEDMLKQVEAATFVRKKAIALVTDSTCDLPKENVERYNIHVVPVMINIDNKSYRDRTEISTYDFYQILKTNQQKLTTSQPPVAEFTKVFEPLAEKYDTILSLHISEALSGTINGARTAAKNIQSRTRFEIINSRTTSAALGLLVSEAGRLIETGSSIEEIVQHLHRAIEHVRLFVSIPTLKYLMRSGRLHVSKGLLATLLQIKPVISINREGRVVEIAKVIGRKRVEEKTLELAIQYGKTFRNPKFSIVHILSPELAARYRHAIQSYFSVQDVPILDASPALGLHTGVGSAAIAVLGDY